MRAFVFSQFAAAMVALRISTAWAAPTSNVTRASSTPTRQAMDRATVACPQSIVADYENGKQSFAKNDYGAAITRWRSLLSSSDELACGGWFRPRLSLSLATALELNFRTTATKNDLLEASRLILDYADQIDLDHAKEPLVLLREQRRASDRLARLDASLTKVNGYHDAPFGSLPMVPIVETKNEQPATLPALDNYAAKHNYMMLGGALLTAFGTGALIFGAVELGRGKNTLGAVSLVTAALVSPPGIVIGYFGFRRSQLGIARNSDDKRSAMLVLSGAML